MKEFEDVRKRLIMLKKMNKNEQYINAIDDALAVLNSAENEDIIKEYSEEKVRKEFPDDETAERVLHRVYEEYEIKKIEGDVNEWNEDEVKFLVEHKNNKKSYISSCTSL